MARHKTRRLIITTPKEEAKRELGNAVLMLVGIGVVALWFILG